VLAKREQINNVLRVKLDEVTARWCVKITNVEIREIVPPRDIQDAMNRQMSAERNRRALITESEGTRQATINVAEGDKQSNILRAEGDRQSQILKAEGYANALQTIFGAASGIDEKTMTLQYFDALKALGATQATKFVIPLEFTEMSRMLGRYVDRSMDEGGGSGGAAAARPAARPATSPGPQAGGTTAGTTAGPGPASVDAGSWTPGADRSPRG